MIISNRWDSFFFSVAHDCASMSKCLSRQIGTVIVRDHRVVSTGWNGPPQGVRHCGERRLADKNLNDLLTAVKATDVSRCPRQLLGASSGKLIDLCPAVHAEVNSIVNAARLGVSTTGTTMYMTCGVPCRNCMSTIINAGIKEIVCTSLEFYDETSRFLLFDSSLKIRLYDQPVIDKYKLRYEK